jgi:hypothetical protein
MQRKIWVSARMLAPYMYKSEMTNDVLVARKRSAFGKLTSNNKTLSNCFFYNEFKFEISAIYNNRKLSGALFDGTRMWVSQVNGKRIVGLALGTFHMVLNCSRRLYTIILYIDDDNGCILLCSFNGSVGQTSHQLFFYHCQIFTFFLATIIIVFTGIFELV